MYADLDNDMINYNKVKDLVIGQVGREGYMTADEVEEFSDRVQVLVYKGKWFSKWFEKNISVESDSKNSYYMRIISMNEKDPDLEDSALRNRRLKAGIYRNIFKKLLKKSFPEIMDKKELDFTEVIFHSTKDELLDCMNIIFPDHETLTQYQKDYADFLKEANDVALTIGFQNGTQLTLED